MHHRSTSSLGTLRTLTIVLLATGTLVRCDCEETTFIPSGNYMPGNVLDFGEVAVDTEKTLGIVVLSDGSAAFQILDIVEQFDADDTGKWTVVVDDALTNGLTPSQTATITVTYRPCPEAWNGDTINDNYTFDLCPGDPDSGVLDITDNSRTQNRKIDVTAIPVQPPTIRVKCPVSMGGIQCNVEDPDLQTCNGLAFGPVTAGETPCDLVLEIENAFRRDTNGNLKRVGTLNVEGISMEVRDLNSNDQVTKRGPEVGFTILDMDGSPLSLSAANPLQVPIDPNAGSGPTQGTFGTKRFKIRFDGSASGTWAGLVNEGNGLRFFSDDPDQRVIGMNVSAIGAAANLECFPPLRDFGPVMQGTTATTSFSCQNSGDAILEVYSMAVESGNGEFVVSADIGGTPFMVNPFTRFNLEVAYTPGDGGVDIETVVVMSNDLRDDGRLELGLRGGAVPTCQVPDVLVFPLTPGVPPPQPPRTVDLQVLSTGFGDCVVERLDILEDNASKDDFTIDLPQCSGGLPCTLGVTLPPMVGQLDIPITYDNTDISTTDSVNLHVYTNDPGNPDQIVILQAMDDPCFYPNAIIEVETERPCVGMPVRVNALNSDPGGNGMTTTITSFRWHWLFAPDQAQFAPQGMDFTTFIPGRDGMYFLGLEVVNDCGAMSQSPGTEMINVSSSCN